MAIKVKATRDRMSAMLFGGAPTFPNLERRNLADMTAAKKTPEAMPPGFRSSKRNAMRSELVAQGDPPDVFEERRLVVEGVPGRQACHRVDDRHPASNSVELHVHPFATNRPMAVKPIFDTHAASNAGLGLAQ